MGSSLPLHMLHDNAHNALLMQDAQYFCFASTTDVRLGQDDTIPGSMSSFENPFTIAAVNRVMRWGQEDADKLATSALQAPRHRTGSVVELGHSLKNTRPRVFRHARAVVEDTGNRHRRDAGPFGHLSD